MQEWSKGLIDRINFAQLYEAKCVKQVTLVKDKSMDLAHEIRRPATFQECLSYVAGDDLEPTRISDADTKELTVAMETATNSVPVPTPLRWF